MSMDNLLLLVCLLFGHGITLVPLVHCLINEYHFVNLNLTWADARQYCREHFTDLATVESAEDWDRMDVPVDVDVWIGLHDDPAAWKKVMGSEQNSWRWSATGSTSPGGFQKWIWYEPNRSYGKEFCVFTKDGTWQDYFCYKKLAFCCFTVQSGIKEFICFNTTKLSWTKARDYCRQHYVDLAMIESPEENQAVAASSQIRWIGLSRISWVWSDGSNSSYRIPSFPKSLDGKLDSKSNRNCIVQTPTRKWISHPCTREVPFICHKVPKRSFISKVKLSVQTSADVSDPLIQAQLLKQLEEILQAKTTGSLRLEWDNPPKKKTEI